MATEDSFLQTLESNNGIPSNQRLLLVKQVLGHKRIENTLIYIQPTKELFKDEIEYISKVAKNEGEACVLIDAALTLFAISMGINSSEKRSTEQRITLRKPSVCFTILVPGVGLEFLHPRSYNPHHPIFFGYLIPMWGKVC